MVAGPYRDTVRSFKIPPKSPASVHHDLLLEGSIDLRIPHRLVAWCSNRDSLGDT